MAAHIHISEKPKCSFTLSLSLITLVTVTRSGVEVQVGRFGPISTFIVWRSVIPKQGAEQNWTLFRYFYFFLSLSLSSFTSAPHACWAKIRPLSLPEIEWLLLSANRRAAFVNRTQSLLAVWYDKQTVNGDGGSSVISRSQEHFLSHFSPPLLHLLWIPCSPPHPNVFFYPIFLEVWGIPLTPSASFGGAGVLSIFC